LHGEAAQREQAPGWNSRLPDAAAKRGRISPGSVLPLKKPMLAAMTSKGVIACQHQSVVDCEWFQLVPEATKRTQ